jgi:hypothetical protein
MNLHECRQTHMYARSQVTGESPLAHVKGTSSREWGDASEAGEGGMPNTRDLLDVCMTKDYR